MSMIRKYHNHKLQTTPWHLFQSKESDREGFLKLLQALNISKTAVRPRVLKDLSSDLAPILTLLFLASLHKQSLPDIWKDVSVNPIYKK